MNDSVLVTGATGMLGAHLLYNLTSSGQPVRALYRKGSDRDLVAKIFAYYTDNAPELSNLINWVEADLLNIPRLEDAMDGIEQVYHCAAMVSFAPKDADRLVEMNPKITANVVNVALEKKIKKLVHVSSVAALGRQKQGEEISEETEWVESNQNSAYAKSKYLAELEVWRGTQEGLDAVIVNPSIILGPGKWQEGSAALFGRVASGFKFYTNGVNAYVDARDVAEAMTRLMQSDITSERFVLVSENKSYKYVFQTIAEKLEAKKPSIHAKPWMGEIVWRMEVLRSNLFGGTPLVTKDTARTSHQMNFYSSEKIRKRLDFNFRPVEDSIKDIAGIYRNENSK